MRKTTSVCIIYIVDGKEELKEKIYIIDHVDTVSMPGWRDIEWKGVH